VSRRASLVDDGCNVGNDRVAFVGLGHHAVLHIDDDQRGIRAVGEWWSLRGLLVDHVFAYQSGQFASACPISFSCWP